MEEKFGCKELELIDDSQHKGPRLSDNPVWKFHDNSKSADSILIESVRQEGAKENNEIFKTNRAPKSLVYGKFSRAWDTFVERNVSFEKIPVGAFQEQPRRVEPPQNPQADGNKLLRANNFLKEFRLLKRLVKFSDRLRITVGLRDINKAPRNAIAMLNDLSYFNKLKWNQKEDFLKANLHSALKRKSFANVFSAAALSNTIRKYTFRNFGIFRGILKKGFTEAWSLFDEKIPAFEPFGKFKLFWDAVMLILIFWHLYSLTVMHSFGLKPWQSYSLTFECLQNAEGFNYFKKCSIILLLFDIVIKLNTACFVGGNEIYKKADIMKNYLRDGFFYDITGLCPFIIFYFKGSSYSDDVYSYYYCLFLFKLRPLVTFLENIKEGLLFLDGKKEACYQLIRLMIEVFIICHLFSCVWHLAASKSDTSNNWISYFHLGDKPWEERYFKAIYYVVVTMTTTGYGDITPQNRTETLISVILMFLGSALVGYSVNSIGRILDTIQADQKTNRIKMRFLNSFMKRHSIKYELQVKIRKYLQYLWGKNLEQEKKCQEILRELPKYLREEALIESRAQILKNAPYLAGLLSQSSFSSVCLAMKQIDLGPEEWIFTNEEKEEPCLYFIISGNVELVATCQKRGERFPVLQMQGPGTFFGEKAFFTGFPHDFSAKTQAVCSLYKLERSAFLKIVSAQEKDHELFCLTRDKLIMNEPIRKLEIGCSVCRSQDHKLFSCPWINPRPVKELAIQRFLFSRSQSRRLGMKRRSAKGNSLRLYVSVNHAARKFKEESNLQSLNTFGCESFKTMSESNIETHEKGFQISPKDEPGFINKAMSLNNNKVFDEHNIPSPLYPQKISKLGSDTQLPHSPGNVPHFKRHFEREEHTGVFHHKSIHLNIPSSLPSKTNSIVDDSPMSDVSPLNSRSQSREIKEEGHPVADCLSSLEHDSPRQRLPHVESKKIFLPLFSHDFDRSYEWKYYFKQSNMPLVVRSLKNYRKRPLHRKTQKSDPRHSLLNRPKPKSEMGIENFVKPQSFPVATK